MKMMTRSQFEKWKRGKQQGLIFVPWVVELDPMPLMNLDTKLLEKYSKKIINTRFYEPCISRGILPEEMGRENGRLSPTSRENGLQQNVDSGQPPQSTDSHILLGA